MKDKWAEALAENFSFGLVQFMGILVIAVPLFLLDSLMNFFVGVALAVFVGLFIITIVNAGQAIFIRAVYRVQGEEIKLVSNDQVSELLNGRLKRCASLQLKIFKAFL